ncbi:hypothetical protein [Rossellomorea aquimaris]|uniref:hypothetical protein n=1 Tax=Rossellomorea aquimaris TaxID=189382 RepID=UPI0007D0944A|nr:hypothetical protein [Rossellomorea aquimaris]
MKTILRYSFFIMIMYLAILLYRFHLGAIPFFLVSFYLFYEAFRIIRNGEKEEKWGKGKPS